MAEISNTTETIYDECGDRSVHVEPFHRQGRIDGTLSFHEQVATMQHILYTNGIDGRLRATISDQQGGIWKRTIHSGIGKRPSVDATVRLHYYAYFEHQDEPFDSSFKRRRPLEFRLGKYSVLPGIELAVSTMQRRERAKFIISSDLLYGELGCAPHIPQSAWCFYLIELLSSVEPTNYGSDELFLMKVNDGHQIDDFAKRIRLAQTLRNAGNEDYAHGNLDRALRNYNKAKQLVQNRVHLIDGQHEEQYHQLLLKLHLNSAQCHLRLENYRFCFASCRDALLIEPNNLKALFRAAVSLRMLDRLDEAEKYLAEAIQIDGENQEIQMEATNLTEAKALATEKSMMNKKSTKNELSLTELDELLATIDVSDDFRIHAETVLIEGDLLESENCSKTELIDRLKTSRSKPLQSVRELIGKNGRRAVTQ